MFDDILKKRSGKKEKRLNLITKKDKLTAKEIVFLLGVEFEKIYEDHLIKFTSKENYAAKLENIILDALIRGDYPFQSVLGNPKPNP